MPKAKLIVEDRTAFENGFIAEIMFGNFRIKRQIGHTDININFIWAIAKVKESSGNVSRDLDFPEAEARKLKFRSFLMIMLMKFIQKRKFTQTEAAKYFGGSQSRISHLMHCRIDSFSADMLLDMLERIGFNIYDKVERGIASVIRSESKFLSGFSHTSGKSHHHSSQHA